MSYGRNAVISYPYNPPRASTGVVLGINFHLDQKNDTRKSDWVTLFLVKEFLVTLQAREKGLGKHRAILGRRSQFRTRNRWKGKRLSDAYSKVSPPRLGGLGSGLDYVVSLFIHKLQGKVTRYKCYHVINSMMIASLISLYLHTQEIYTHRISTHKGERRKINQHMVKLGGTDCPIFR